MWVAYRGLDACDRSRLRGLPLSSPALPRAPSLVVQDLVVPVPPSAPSVVYREISARSLLRSGGFVDPWFLGGFGVNLYRGCEHGCVYCDGRAERYQAPGDFQHEIEIKTNALALARRELLRIREPGFLLLGGGVCDSYQPAEQRYRLARGLLELAREKKLCAHVLTKSASVERDFDVLQDIQRENQVIVSFSLQTHDDSVRERFEPGAATVKERLRVLERARALGFGGGIMAMPFLPGISDRPLAIQSLVEAARDAGAQFFVYGGLTLRPGRQKEAYLEVIREHYPELVAGYERAYASERPSGAPDPRYPRKLERRVADVLGRCALPIRIPRDLFQGHLPRYAEASVLLEHEEARRRLRGEPGESLGRAGQALALWVKQRRTALFRRAGLSYLELEREFSDRVRDGSLVQIPGVSAAALRAIERLGFGDARPTKE